jgi:hypothetical protein
VEPAVVASQGPGTICAGSVTGLSCLNENGWQLYTEENSELPNNYLYAGAICSDGQFAIAHINGVVLFDGTTFKQIPEMDTVSSPEGIACDSDGEIWVAHFQGVSHYADGQWTTYGSELLATGAAANELVYDVRVAPDGTVWVLTSNSVASFQNDTWTVFQEGQGFNESRFFNALTVDANGRPWAAHSTWTHYDRTSAGPLSNHVASLASDSRGRVWLGTTYGLTVFDGTNWQTFLMSNSGLADNDVRFVIATNDGPALPEVEEKESGSLTGTVEQADGTPLADARVEICVETIGTTFYGDTPCSDQPFLLSAKTDTDGAFLIENVPAGYYGIITETGTGWARLVDDFGLSSERTLIQPGEQHDIGTITLEN